MTGSGTNKQGRAVTDHQKHAEALLAALPDLLAAPPQLQATIAQAHATLALVEVLRISSAPGLSPTPRAVDSPPPKFQGGIDRPCPECSGPVLSSYPATVYCSDRCKNRAKYQRRLASGYERAREDARRVRYQTDPAFRADVDARLAAARSS